MTTDVNQIMYGNKEFRDVPIDLEFDLYLFEMFLGDHIENQVQRMMDCSVQNSKIAKPPSFSANLTQIPYVTPTRKRNGPQGLE